jgi:cell division septation protein DedD
MRGFLDDDYSEPTPLPQRDRELTLGNLTLLGIFLGLVVLCALCYGVGYEVGRGSAGPVLTLPAGTPASSTASLSKRSTTAENAPTAEQTNNTASTPALARSHLANPPAGDPSQVAQQAAPSVLAVRTIPAPPQPRVLPALPSGPYMVQITAVSNPDDGELLVNALKKHGYQVTTRREGDGLIHVRLGPFSTRDDASHWRQKLLSDGYSATIER